MKTIDVQNDNAPSLKELVKLVESGGEIVLTDGQERIARVFRFTFPQSQEASPEEDEKIVLPPRKLGLHIGAIETSQDFDDPLPDTFWQGNG